MLISCYVSRLTGLRGKKACEVTEIEHSRILKKECNSQIKIKSKDLPSEITVAMRGIHEHIIYTPS